MNLFNPAEFCLICIEQVTGIKTEPLYIRRHYGLTTHAQNWYCHSGKVFGTSSSSSHSSSFNATLPGFSSSDATSIDHTVADDKSFDVAFSDTASYGATLTDPTFTDEKSSEASSPDVTTSNLTAANGLTKTLAQSIELASDCLAKLGVIDLSSDSVREILKMCTAEEENGRILTSVNPKEAEISSDAENLIKVIKDPKVLSCNNLRNIFYTNGYKLNYHLINHYDIGLLENLVKPFLDLIESPKNLLNSTILERSAAVITTIMVTNQLLLANNDIIELENTMLFEGLTVYEEVLFRIEHAAVIASRTIRELVKFTDNLPKLIIWKNAIVAHIEQF